MSKDKIREKHKLKRCSIDSDKALYKSEEIKKRLFSLPEFSKANTVLLYASIKDEVDTAKAIRECLGKKRIILPVTDKDTKEILLSEISSPDNLRPGYCSVPEPKMEDIKNVNPEEIDIAIVPGIAFDRSGNRLGWGKGCYDRLLKFINAPKIALAYSCQLEESIPAQEHDVAVDMIITEKEAIDCRKKS